MSQHRIVRNTGLTVTYLVGKASPGMMKVVVLGPKLEKKKVRA
jgi:hypothetical protein